MIGFELYQLIDYNEDSFFLEKNTRSFTLYFVSELQDRLSSLHLFKLMLTLESPTYALAHDVCLVGHQKSKNKEKYIFEAFYKLFLEVIIPIFSL